MNGMTDRFGNTGGTGADSDGGTIAGWDRGALRTLLVACAITAVLWFLPYAAFLTYPIRLLVTFLHEGGHALAALATGGAVTGMAVYPDGSGVTYTQGGWRLAILPAGYLGATVYGAGLLALLRRRLTGRTLLMITAVSVGLLTLLFVRPWANLFGFGWGVVLTTALVLAGLKLSPKAAGATAGFLGVQCALNALFDLRTLLQLSWGHPAGGPRTDAAQMAGIIPLPAVIWALLWIGLSAALLWVVLRPARGRGEK